MKRFILIFLVTVCISAAAHADLASGPVASFLWNRFNAVTIRDSLALATSDFGISLLKLNSVTGLFDPISNLLLRNQTQQVKIVNDIALVSTTADLLYIVDLSQLPQLRQVGEIDLGISVYDAVLIDSDLYLACGFDGLRHYKLSEGHSLQFVDSSLTPIHCMQVDSQGPYLIVLDDYNGLLRFRPDAGGLGTLESTILVPRWVESFILAGDTLILPLVNKNLVYRASFNSPAGLVDSIPLTAIPDRTFAVDTLLIAVDIEGSSIETVSTVSGAHLLVQLDPGFELLPQGGTYYDHDAPRLLMVSEERTLVSFNLTGLWYEPAPRPAYAHPGPISALGFHRGRLVTGGGYNLLELYNVQSPAAPVFDTAFFGATDVNAVANAGDVLFTNFVSAWPLSAIRFGDSSITTVSTLSAYTRPTYGLSYYSRPLLDTTSLLLAAGENSVDLISVSQNWQMRRTDIARVLANVLDIALVDSYLLISTDDSQLQVFKVLTGSTTPFRAIFWSSVPTPAPINHVVYTGMSTTSEGWTYPIILHGFSGNQMYEIAVHTDGRPSLFALGTVPVDVTESVLAGSRLYTVGSRGVGIFDATPPIPRIIDYGGYGGHLIAFQDSVLAVSDGTAVHLYTFSAPGSSTPVETEVVMPNIQYLQQNYPNPFNPRTRIDFALPASTHVDLEICDLLGRQVVSLVNGEVAAGTNSVEWDGTDSFGNRVASGVYFYRLTAPGIAEARKMILLK
ncbi:MAG: T9SS type A sorting domain-containing protein [candidate division Zixibacteria bacterium]|nr:T9SS type A sorting domain-containing protein [candidate division Zixibacteria bacterium]